jgi:hypothetical protein
VTESGHPEEFCSECGAKNVCWFTPNELWNAIVRNENATDPMLCPTCFIRRAVAAGYDRDAWKVAPEFFVPTSVAGE